MARKALICGISGQDGAYLARLLADKGYEVHGTSRDAQMTTFDNLGRLGVRERVSCHSMAGNDFRSVLNVLARVRPDEIYNLAGQSSVALSFDQPVETLESISIGTLNLLEGMRFLERPMRLYNAGSSECFGNVGHGAAGEETPFRPRSPYAVAKAAAFWEVANYREAYGLYACTGILFNHESPLRPERFVTQKIIKGACRIAAGQADKLRMGNIAIFRDWGFAGDYVEAMWAMLQQEEPDDFVIATGEIHSLREFIEKVFDRVGLALEWRGEGIEEQGIVAGTNRVVIDIDAQYFRPAEVSSLYGNPSRARKRLAWQPRIDFDGLVTMMVDEELAQMKRRNNTHG
jgi:GDPmannose 4,6-dehydratase